MNDNIISVLEREKNNNFDEYKIKEYSYNINISKKESKY